jgi:hypothetical protein
MRLKLELDQELSEALQAAAERELRYPHQQLEVLLRQALGLPFPPHNDNPREKHCLGVTSTEAADAPNNPPARKDNGAN